VVIPPIAGGGFWRLQPPVNELGQRLFALGGPLRSCGTQRAGGNRRFPARRPRATDDALRHPCFSLLPATAAGPRWPSLRGPPRFQPPKPKTTPWPCSLLGGGARRCGVGN